MNGNTCTISRSVEYTDPAPIKLIVAVVFFLPTLNFLKLLLFIISKSVSPDPTCIMSI